MANGTSEKKKWRRVVLLSILEKLYFCVELTWGILTLGLALFCLAKFMNPPTFTSLSMEPAKVFHFPVITVCRDPFWRDANQTCDQSTLELPYGTEITMDILWKLKNSSSHSVLSPLRTVTFGQSVGTKRKDWKTGRNMFLEADPGLNFLKKGKWSSNFFRDFDDNIHLCFTLIDTEDYKQDDSHFLIFETNDNRTRWLITLSSPMDALSNVFKRSSSSMFQFTIESAHTHHVIFHVEEYNFLNRKQFKCNKAGNYTYTSCVEKCLKEDFVKGQMSRDNPCRIIGFEEAEELESCQSRKEHDKATRPVTTQDWNYTGLEMAADIGGYVGVVLGISLLSISHGILERVRRFAATDQEAETKK
ncbi:unnamed protein product [Cyprideis torosa]|uniref:Uncharacterized protein n=1 Tax=Cyprideis torosa TaxID=163714 RepID=A0A7R8ZQK0_9CRUS|nr:unnamed protein product [Cyprideis torosa]CAG0903095.1 unnamed protein product [Cyprideis torosa]